MINIPIAEVINIGCMWQLTRMPILITLEVSYVSLDTAALIYPVFNKSIKSDEKRHFMSMKTYVLWNYTMHHGINLPHDDNLCNCQHKSRRIGQFYSKGILLRNLTTNIVLSPFLLDLKLLNKICLKVGFPHPCMALTDKFSISISLLAGGTRISNRPILNGVANRT